MIAIDAAMHRFLPAGALLGIDTKSRSKHSSFEAHPGALADAGKGGVARPLLH